MKDPVSIIVFVAVFLIVAVRLYLRYKGKETFNPHRTKPGSGSGFIVKEDDYEPYKNK